MLQKQVGLIRDTRRHKKLSYLKNKIDSIFNVLLELFPWIILMTIFGCQQLFITFKNNLLIPVACQILQNVSEQYSTLELRCLEFFIHKFHTSIQVPLPI